MRDHHEASSRRLTVTDPAALFAHLHLFQATPYILRFFRWVVQGTRVPAEPHDGAGARRAAGLAPREAAGRGPRRADGQSGPVVRAPGQSRRGQDGYGRRDHLRSEDHAQGALESEPIRATPKSTRRRPCEGARHRRLRCSRFEAPGVLPCGEYASSTTLIRPDPANHRPVSS